MATKITGVLTGDKNDACNTCSCGNLILPTGPEGPSGGTGPTGPTGLEGPEGPEGPPGPVPEGNDVGDRLRWTGLAWIPVTGDITTLTDVDTSGVVAGQYLIWNGVNWVPDTLYLGNHTPTPSSLADVDVTGLVDDDMLVYDSALTKWKPGVPAMIQPVVIYATNLQQVKDAFDYFNNVGGINPNGSQAGIVKLGASIDLDADLDLNFGEGIEIYGGGNRFKLYNGVTRYRLIIGVGSKRSTFVNCLFTGTREFSPAGTDEDSQVAIEINSSICSRLLLMDCEFVGIVGEEDHDYYEAEGTNGVNLGAPIQVTSMYAWSRLIFSNIWILTSASGSQKDYAPLGVFYKTGAQPGPAGLQIICNNWAVTGVTNENQPYHWTDYKKAMRINVNGTHPSFGTVGYAAISYDGSLTINQRETAASDPGSATTLGDWNPYPTMYGPMSTVAAIDPRVTAHFGNPGDIMTDGSGNVYIKTLTIGINTSWCLMTCTP
ncbi:MAG: hypothetical protein ABGY11_09105 [Candidatus Thioglobus sp.]